MTDDPLRAALERDRPAGTGGWSNGYEAGWRAALAASATDEDGVRAAAQAVVDATANWHLPTTVGGARLSDALIALRAALAASATDEGPVQELDHEHVDTNHPDFEPDVLARPAVPALDVERLAEAIYVAHSAAHSAEFADWHPKTEWSDLSSHVQAAWIAEAKAILAALSPKEPTDAP